MTNVENIVNFVDNWRANNNISYSGQLKEADLKKFTQEFYSEIDKMSFNGPPESKIIPYNGRFGDVPAWQAAEGVINIV